MNNNAQNPSLSTGETDPKRRRKLGFSCLFLIEMWERFGYYGMQILIVVFLKIFMGFSDTNALLTWGAFAAMIYTTPIIGGWIGDRVLGLRRTTMLGAIVLAIGYLLLALPMPNWFIFFAFGVIATGNGLFKANPNNLLSQLYEDDKSELDGAFTLYYMSINIGALASQILTPLVRVNFGWHLAFGVSFIGLMLGVTNFFFMKKYLSHVGSKPDFEPISYLRLIAVIAGTFVVSVIIALIVFNVFVAKFIVFIALAGLIGLFGYLILTESEGESKGFIATIILTLQGLLFFIFYQQMSTSLTLFALRNVHLNFYGYQIPPEQFQVLNPFWIFILSPILAWIYNKLGEQDKDLNIATKFSFGFVLLAIGFFIYGVSRFFAYGGRISPWWMIAGYFFQSFGELLISGLGLAMVSRFVAHRWRGTIMGGWLLTTGISQYVGSMVANAASVPDTLTKVLELVPAQHQTTFTQLPATLKHTLSNFDLGAFRYWLAGSPTSQQALQNASSAARQKFQGFSTSVQHSLQNMSSFSGLPASTQHDLIQLNQDFYHATLPLYTKLFLILGAVAVVAAIISFALNPYLKRLSAEHDALTSGPENAGDSGQEENDPPDN